MHKTFRTMRFTGALPRPVNFLLEAMMPKSKSEWLAATCVILSVAWLYAGINFEPLLALLTSILAFMGLRKSHLKHERTATVESGNGQFDPLALLKPAALFERIKILRKSHMYLKGISSSEMQQALELIPLYERTEALKLLAPSLAAHPSSSETEEVMNMVPLYERAEAAASLAEIVASKKLIQPTRNTRGANSIISSRSADYGR